MSLRILLSRLVGDTVIGLSRCVCEILFHFRHTAVWPHCDLYTADDELMLLLLLLMMMLICTLSAAGRWLARTQRCQYTGEFLQQSGFQLWPYGSLVINNDFTYVTIPSLHLLQMCCCVSVSNGNVYSLCIRWSAMCLWTKIMWQAISDTWVAIH